MNAIIVSLLIAAAPAAPAKPDLKAELTAQMEKWATDFNSHSAAAMAAHYTDDVQFIYAFEGQEGSTKKAIEGFYTQSFKATPDIAVKLVSYDVVQISPTIAFGAGVWEDSFTGPDGKKMTVPAHSSEVFVKKGKKWLVRADHASFVPPPAPPPPAADAKKPAAAPAAAPAKK